jgi:hypothetical protein
MSGNSLYSTASDSLALAGGSSSAPPPPAKATSVQPAPAPAKPAPSTTASAVAPSAEQATGSSEIKLRVSGDHYKGAPHFNLSVDGKIIASNQAATAVHNNGEWIDLNFRGGFSKTPQTVSVTFTDDAWGGTKATDKNLFIDYISVNGTRYQGESVSPNDVDPNAAVLWANGTLTFATHGSTSATPLMVPATTGSSDMIVRVSGDQYKGAPHFDVTVDGKTVATNLSATAVHAEGEWVDLSIKGDFSNARHKVGITFTDDAWGGTTSTDRNLYIDYISMNGKRYEAESVSANKVDSNAAAALWSNGTLTFTTDGPGPLAAHSFADQFFHL